MSLSIPLSLPDITQAEIDAVLDVLRVSTLASGPRVEELERLCAKTAGRQHGVAVSSGTAGLHTALLAAGIKPGDEVITTPFSSVASTNCILYLDAKPVFVDIDPKTLNMDVGKVAGAITPKTRAVVAVEAFGHPGGMIELEQIAQQHELPLIEDACDGFGGGTGNRAIGSFGRAGVFGFGPNRQVTTGEGGMIVTDDDMFAATCRSLRNQGWDENWLTHQRLGYNYRLSEINAALGVAQVSRLEEIIANRRRVAQEYIERLMTNRHLILPTVRDDIRMSWFVFVVRLNDLFEPGDRETVIKELGDQGIGGGHYYPPIHLQPYVMQKLGTKAGDYPVTEYVSARTLALPFFTQMTGRDVERVCTVLEAVLEKTSRGGNSRFTV